MNLVNKRKKAVVYLRVSTEMQVDGYSLDAQLESVERYAKTYNIDIVENGIYQDKGKSGKSIEARPEFIRMLDDIETKKKRVHYVLVYKLSRFGRNAADVLTSLQKLQKNRVNLICTDDGTNSRTGSGKLMIAILSSVAEIERVNILEQTMSGRKQKAREGKWNGGFAPYGYKLENGCLVIEPKEAEAISLIYSKFIETDLGKEGVAKYLNRQGVKKIPRKNGKLTRWSSKFVGDILDNPVYCGKIAYGRRKKEKIDDDDIDDIYDSDETDDTDDTDDTDNTDGIYDAEAKYHLVKQDDYILSEGIHEGIISIEDWEKVRAKRSETGGKSPSTVGRDRVHLLAGILRCPECGGPMYSNKNNVKRKGSGVEEVFYYGCSRAKQERGLTCSYRMSYRKDDIEPIVVSAIRDLVNNQEFATQIKALIGKEVDTSEIEKELNEYKKSLIQCETVKKSLEREIDTLAFDAPYRERKLQDMNKRLDYQYNEIYGLEKDIEDLLKKKQAVETNALNLEQVYQMLLNFDKFYDLMTDAEQRKMVSEVIKEIEVYKKVKPRDKSKLRSISFRFPIAYNDKEGDKILWDNESTVETVVLLYKK